MKQKQGAQQVMCTLRERSEPGAPPSAASLRAEDSERTKRERALRHGPTKAVSRSPQLMQAPERRAREH